MTEKKTTKRAPAKRAAAKPVTQKRASAKPAAKKTTAAKATKPRTAKTEKPKASSAKPKTAPSATSEATNNTEIKLTPETATKLAAGKLQEMIESGLLSKETITSAAETVQKTALNPEQFSKHQTQLMAELVKVARGDSEITPGKGDRRFNDETWTQNPFYRSMMQSYLAVGTTMKQWLDSSDIDARQMERSRVILSNMMDALSPTNTLWGKPCRTEKGVQHLRHEPDRRCPKLCQRHAQQQGNAEPGR